MTTTKWFGDRQEGDQPGPYIYHAMPDRLRGKIRFAILDTLDSVQRVMPPNMYIYPRAIRRVSRALGEDVGDGSHDDLESFLKNANLENLFTGIEAVLDELLFLTCQTEGTSTERKVGAQIGGLVGEINKLFALFHLGYRIITAVTSHEDEPAIQIVRIDSEFTHKEMVEPALRLLQEEGFEPASRQFSEALREYTGGNHGDAITDANSAFESVLKRVLGRKSGTAHQLIGQAQKAGYFPSYLENTVAQFADLLNGLSIVRDQEGDAHGRLDDNADPENLARTARYAIHLAAANIIFIMDEYNQRKKAQ